MEYTLLQPISMFRSARVSMELYAADFGSVSEIGPDPPRPSTFELFTEQKPRCSISESIMLSCVALCCSHPSVNKRLKYVLLLPGCRLSRCWVSHCAAVTEPSIKAPAGDTVTTFPFAPKKPSTSLLKLNRNGAPRYGLYVM